MMQISRKHRFDADAHLVTQAQDGDKAAFGRLVRKYQERILYLIYDYIGNYENAKDAAQEVFMKAFQSIQNFKGEAAFSTWLYRIAVNTAGDFLRKEKRMQKLDLSAELQDDRQQIEQSVEIRDLKNRIENHLDKLSFQQQTAIILRYFHDQPIKEIAGVMTCKENTVRIHLLRALEKLKYYLKEQPR
jgi:RNA polymerase sigma-70 factor (ECF subfamily)